MRSRWTAGLLAIGLALGALALWRGADAPPREPESEPAPAAAPAEAQRTADPARGRAAPASPAPPPVPARLQPPPQGLHALPRARVEAALARREVLERSFEPGRVEHDGRHLLKLGEIDPAGFYAALGLESRDVLLLVDGEWVTDRHNPLWEALRSREEVVLVVMRRGTPRSWRVRIE